MKAVRVAIVGAGVAGLSAARALTALGYAPVIFEKSRGLGGRCATRRVDEAGFDHGAQYFTVRDPRFRRALDACRAPMAPYTPRLATIDANGATPMDSGTERFVAMPGMSALAAAFGAETEVRRQVRIASLDRGAEGWRLGDEHGRSHGPFAALALSMPPAQSAALLGSEDALAVRLGGIRMLPCWAGMLAFPGPLPVEFDAAFVAGGDLSWIARDSAKPGRADGERWVAHVAPPVSEAWLEHDPAEVAVRIRDAFFAALRIEPVPPLLAIAHRWRYALAEQPVQDGCWSDADRRIVVGGDWCCGSRIEGAFLSGLAMAERLDQALRATS